MCVSKWSLKLRYPSILWSLSDRLSGSGRARSSLRVGLLRRASVEDVRKNDEKEYDNVHY